MRPALRTAALCLASALLGWFAAVGPGGPGPGPVSGGSTESSPSWVERVPVLGRITGSREHALDSASATAERVAEADVLVARAPADPVAAMRGAIALDGYWLKRDTLERIALAWARQAPVEALSHVNRSRDLGAAKRPLRVLVLDTWARADPVDALDYLSGPVGSELFFTDQSAATRTIGVIADSEPFLLLTRAGVRSPGFIRDQLRRAAINVIVERDPEFAERQIALAASEAERAEWELSLRLAEERRAATDRPD